MTGIFGYFDQNNINENINDFVHSVEETGYRIIDREFNQSCLLGKLDIKNSKIKKSIIKEDGISLVFCGEIYNEDVDNLGMIILKLYKEGELNLVKNLNGLFVAAIYDMSEEKITLVNDRYGLIKTYYYHNENINDVFSFSPKIKPLLTCNLDRKLRKDSIIDFFTFGYLLGEKTFFNDIHQLPSASILEFSRGDLKITSYWNYEYNEDSNIKSEEDLIEELGNLWQQAVERRIKKDEKILIPLSGGLDSRAILAAALKCTSKENIITFTFGNPGSFDFEIGKMVAKKAGVTNIELGVEKESFEKQYRLSIDDIEGMIDATPYFAIKGYKGMKKYGNNILSGYIGDFVMGSHMYPTMLTKNISNELEFDSITDLFLEHEILFDVKIIDKLFSQHFCNNSSNPTSTKEISNQTNKNLANIFFKFFFENHTFNYSFFSVFRNRQLFNYKTPFLDNDLIDFMLNIPPEFRYQQKLYRKMLVKRYSDLFELPTKTNLGLKFNVNNSRLLIRKGHVCFISKVNQLSSRLAKRKIFQDKGKNYIDYDDLLRKNSEYRNYMRSMITKIEEREYFNSNYIEEVWKLHMEGKKNYSNLFGLLVTFELFLQNYVDT